MKIETLHDLFALKIASLYDIETVIAKALPKMAKAAADPDLRQGFLDHLEETEHQAERLEQIFSMIGMKPKKMRVEAIRGLVEDTEWVIAEKPSHRLLDSLLVSCGRYIEHYEMAGYMTAIEWARLLNLDDAVLLLESSLEEEKSADILLSDVAESRVDEMALASGTTDEDTE